MVGHTVGAEGGSYGGNICSLVTGIAWASLPWMLAPQVRFRAKRAQLEGLKDSHLKVKARIWP